MNASPSVLGSRLQYPHVRTYKVTYWHSVLGRTELLEHITGLVFLFKMVFYFGKVQVVSLVFAGFVIVYYLILVLFQNIIARLESLESFLKILEFTLHDSYLESDGHIVKHILLMVAEVVSQIVQ